jgi:hypothetical protein
MKVSSDVREWRVTVHVEHDAEEATFVYDLIQSDRLLVANKEKLPLPFRGEFLVKLPQRPRPIPVHVGRFEASPSEIVKGQGGVRLIFTTDVKSEALLAELESALRDVPPASEDEFKEDSGGAMDEFSRIRKMTFAQRVIYATRAGQSGRTVIMQQPSPMLLLYLCKNPLITLPEVIQIARLPSIDALVAEYIVKLLRSNPKWAMSEELKLALAMNAKTPGGTAISLLPHLNSRNLRELCKKGEVRGPLKNAAMKILLERKI